MAIVIYWILLCKTEVVYEKENFNSSFGSCRDVYKRQDLSRSVRGKIDYRKHIWSTVYNLLTEKGRNEIRNI